MDCYRKTSYCTPAFQQAVFIRYSSRPSFPSVSKITTDGCFPVSALKNSACCRLSKLLRLSSPPLVHSLVVSQSAPSQNCGRRHTCRGVGFQCRRRLRHKTNDCTQLPNLNCGLKSALFQSLVNPGLAVCHGNDAAACRRDTPRHPCLRDAPARLAPPTAIG